MGNAIFPTLPGLAWSVTKTPTWKTKVQTSVSGKETRAAYQARPIWSFSLSYEVLRGYSGLTEYQQLVAFFNQRMGAFDSFLFLDGSDNAVTNQAFGTGDGTTATFALQHAIQSWSEPVGYAPSPTVYVNFGDSRGAVQQYAYARTNFVTFSERFDNGAWTRYQSSLVPNSATAPDGSYTACRFCNGGASEQSLKSANFNFAAGAVYTCSFFAKAGTASSIQGTLSSVLVGTGGAQCVFNLGNGTVTVSGPATAAITAIGGGWYRCTWTFTAIGSATANGVWINLAQAASDSTKNLYLWGAQLEAGSAATSYFPSADTFSSRSTIGTFVGSNGQIQTAPVNGARLQYNPLNLSAPPKLLLEAAATNLALYAQDFTNAAWNSYYGVAAVANSGTAPDGTNTADGLYPVAGSGATGGSIYNGAGYAVTAGTTYVFSVFMKAGINSTCRLGVGTNGQAFGGKVFNLLDTASSNGPGWEQQYMGNGWHRLSITYTAAGNGTVYACIGFGVNLAAANPTSVLYAWGAQFEVGSYATSYIATTGAAVSRGADVSASAAATVTDYTCDGVNVTFGAAPAAGAAFTWTGQFYYRVRFKQDMMDFEQFMKDFWQLKKCELVGVL